MGGSYVGSVKALPAKISERSLMVMDYLGNVFINKPFFCPILLTLSFHDVKESSV